MQADEEQVSRKVVDYQPLPAQEKPVTPTGEPENILCDDTYFTNDREREEHNTPLAMRRRWTREQLAAFHDIGSIPRIQVRQGYRPWTGTAHLEIEPESLEKPLDADGLHLRFSVACNPAYMCRPHDLVPVYLETARNEFRLMVILLEPTWETNYFEIAVDYSLPQLASILKIQNPGKDLLAAVTERYRELGLRAQWLGVQGQRLPLPNGIKHESGGLDQKNGSGKLRLAPYTERELSQSESRRNTSWNMAEKMTRSRPVFQKFGSVLQPGKEMMTSLEAESEYLLADERQLMSVIDAMTELASDQRLQADFGITKLTQKKKLYVDTYFDLEGLPLLAARVVLRRREVPAHDESGTYLFTVKGATFTHRTTQSEKLRLAAQVQLDPAVMESAEKRQALRGFLSTAEVDNAFARVLEHALTAQRQQAVFRRLAEEDITPVLTLTSTRHTFQMSLRDGTVIDFSADLAEASHSGATRQVYSFEFGVGHPALTQAATAAGPTATGGAPGRGRVADLIRQADSGPTIVRPYHVPADLSNMGLFGRTDYKQFRSLRDRLIEKLFTLDKASLTAGGNKAYELAKALGMLKS